MADDAPPKATETPITVRSSTLPAQLAATGRILTILIAGFTAILGFLSGHDLVGLWRWLHTTEGAPFIAAVVTVATFAWSLWTTHKKGGKMVDLFYLAKQSGSAPDSVVQLK